MEEGSSSIGVFYNIFCHWSKNWATQSRGHSSHIDTLNHCMQGWNWRKTTSMVTLLLRKVCEASQMAEEQKDLWQAFSNALDLNHIKGWESLSTAPLLVGGTTSVTKTLLELNQLQKLDLENRQDTEQGFTTPAWIVEGVEIEYQQ
ncbi:hypothetical protein BDV93DRAFT_506185 [Ceratobasidium sp. AG-I]|nr:hypothetical protein BDV93DRAFT_506185 [Ceratobasidium sp. AG-I]